MSIKFPDGHEQDLIKIDDWDFNWQYSYFFEKPLDLPKGSVLNVVSHYNNSDSNPHNPNKPPKLVKWGEATTDEMCVGFIAVTKKGQDLTRPGEKDDLMEIFQKQREEYREKREKAMKEAKEKDASARSRASKSTPSPHGPPPPHLDPLPARERAMRGSGCRAGHCRYESTPPGADRHVMRERLLDFVLGTAGHIDHGKTALVRALTGVDTDRLPAEKQRGITIDLGFASLQVGQYRLALVDVPGHERFIRNMLAGAAGLDLAMLIVAADDSVMPQTREHMEILRLLGLSGGLVVLSKCDLVEPSWIDLVEEDVRSLVRGTFLEGATIVRTSATTGLGLEELKERARGTLRLGRTGARHRAFFAWRSTARSRWPVMGRS